jgi:hypothetical protein
VLLDSGNPRNLHSSLFPFLPLSGKGLPRDNSISVFIMISPPPASRLTGGEKSRVWGSLVGWELHAAPSVPERPRTSCSSRVPGAAPLPRQPGLNNLEGMVQPYLLINDGISPSPTSGEQAKPMRWGWFTAARMELAGLASPTVINLRVVFHHLSEATRHSRSVLSRTGLKKLYKKHAS